MKENNVQQNEETKENTLMEIIKTIALAVVLAVLIKNFIFNTTLVMGQSMEPTLHEKDRLLCVVLPLYFSDPNRGDIITIDAPDGSGDEYIKRCIGVPGDRIDIKDGKVFVNGIERKEDYIAPHVQTEVYYENSWLLGEDEFFVLGDNRHPGASTDSRLFGVVEKKHIDSIAKYRFYPFNNQKSF